jgi:hypothetical protein
MAVIADDPDVLEGEVAELGGTDLPVDWRRYVRRFFATFVVVVGTIVVLNLIADSHGYWGLHVFPVDARDSRAVKLAMIERAHPFDTLVLGSSRSERVSSALIQRLTGVNAFNGGIDAASTGDMEEMWKRAESRDGADLHHLIVFLDPESFRKPSPDVSLKARLSSLVSLSEAHTSAGLVLGHLGLGAVGRKLFPNDATLFAPPKLAPDGHELYRQGFDFTAALRRGGPPPSWRSASTIDGFYADWGPIAGTSGAANFDHLMTSANQHGIVPVVILPPYYPGFLHLAGARWRTEHARVLGYLAKLRPALRFTLEDASDPRRFGANTADFADDVHLGDPEVAKLMTWIEHRVGRNAL